MQDLCTFEDVQALVGTDVADLYNAAALEAICEGSTDVQGLIEEKSRWFETQVGVVFDLQSKVYYLSGKGTNMVLLPDVPPAPIISIVLEYQETGSGWTTSASFAYTDAGVIRLTSAGQDYAQRTDMPRFARGVNNIKTTVAFGSATVPADVRMAVKYLCAIDLLSRYSRWLDKGLKSRSLGDRSETYGEQGRFSQNISAWQQIVDDTILTWSGGIGAAPAFQTG